ncbi:hypothetical protein [Actinomycetospora straminea]|uniref:SAV-6107-like HEPN domain-containing protein n=1 Tax=Actinomycetospora straminea TaxID=663607 RepID=A0ABP9DZE3_9PSEU|nr:hypothetical protein [Actinomycetospora straminea]MDD7931075.1 hypothetical protein [Actinomycetospora straminea]
MNLELSLEQAVAGRVAGTAVADPGAKLDDRDGERAARHRALAGLGAALAVEAEARDAAAAVAARRAETAVWLGASLADLGGVTGRSRQAARKRWPGLGAVHRRRRWLGNHVEDVLWAARLVLDAGLGSPERRAALADAVAAAEAAFAPGAEPRDLEAAVGRWQAFDALVDRHLRGLLAEVPDEPHEPADGASPTVDPGFAAHGARGVLRYFDHAVHAVDEG